MNNLDNWHILIVDDEESIHKNLEITLRKMEHDHKGVTFHHAYSAQEAKTILSNHPHIAVIVLDVMMEQDDAGLNLVRFLRETANNKLTRIILYTGQPGIAPKRDIAENYIIDGYLDKNKSDRDDCYTAVRLALTAYQEHLRLHRSSKKNDVQLVDDIARGYIWLLEDLSRFDAYETISEKINTMLYRAQQLLASYALADLKKSLPTGTTKRERLNEQEYDTLISIHHVKAILNHTSSKDYPDEKASLMRAIIREAQHFSAFRILAPGTQSALKACLEKIDTQALDK